MDTISKDIVLYSLEVHWLVVRYALVGCYSLILGTCHIKIYTEYTEVKLEYCFAREKEIVFVPLSINQFVERTVFLCLICFSIFDKMQGFLDESGLLIYLFFWGFYAEIQNGHQKWQENDFWEKLPLDSADNLWVKKFVEIALSRFDFRDKQVFAFNAEIQDGRQKSDTLWVKNFVEIALSCSFPR